MHESGDRRDDNNVRTTRTNVSPALIGSIVVAVLAIVFILQNGDHATIQLLLFDLGTSVWVAIAVAIVLGAVLDPLLLAWRRRRDA